MSWEPKNWPAFHHRINQVYHMVIAATLVPFALVFLEIDSGRVTDSMLTGWLMWTVLAVFLVVAIGLNVRVAQIMKAQLASIQSDLPIKKRLIIYFLIQKRRYLLLASIGLLYLLGLWLTNNYLFVIGYLLILVQFSLFRPSQDKVIRDLQFTKQEREELRAEILP